MRTCSNDGGRTALRAMRNVLLALGLIFGTFVTIASAEEWSVPDVDKLPMDAFGRTVRAGRDLIVHTAATIGPDAADPAMRYSGNGLECQSCHLDAGNKKFGLPLAGVWGLFPQFIGRENEVRTLEERINGCMERSMNGRALPLDSHEMKAMLAYIRFISAGVPTGRSAEGRATPPLPLPTAASDPTHGAQVFAETCAVCHQPDGQGERDGGELCRLRIGRLAGRTVVHSGRDRRGVDRRTYRETTLGTAPDADAPVGVHAGRGVGLHAVSELHVAVPLRRMERWASHCQRSVWF